MHPTDSTKTPQVYADTDDNVEPSIADIVSEFRDSVQRETTLDTTQYEGVDTVRLVIHMARVPAGSFLLPGRYLQDVGLDSFRAWNMSSTIRFFVNGREKAERRLQKADFDACQMDRNIRKYGVLMFPEADSLSKKGFSINYSLTIPMTDVGTSLNVKGRDGRILCVCDKDTGD